MNIIIDTPECCQKCIFFDSLEMRDMGACWETATCKLKFHYMYDLGSRYSLSPEELYKSCQLQENNEITFDTINEWTLLKNVTEVVERDIDIVKWEEMDRLSKKYTREYDRDYFLQLLYTCMGIDQKLNIVITLKHEEIKKPISPVKVRALILRKKEE